MKYNTKQVNRIKEMEAAMERILNTMASHKPFTDSIQEDLKNLEHYYETEWMKDYESDEKGELPSDLKRGVLSEDGLYDLLYDAKLYDQNFKS